MPGATVVRPLSSVEIFIHRNIAGGVVAPAPAPSPVIFLLCELAEHIEPAALFRFWPPVQTEGTWLGGRFAVKRGLARRAGHHQRASSRCNGHSRCLYGIWQCNLTRVQQPAI